MGPSLLFSSSAIIMNRLFKNKRKKSPETPLQNTFSETPANAVAGPVTHLNIGSQGRRESGSEDRSSRSDCLSPDRVSDGGSQLIFRDRMDEDRELALVTGAYGAAIRGAEQRNNCKGKTSNPCDHDRYSCRPPFLPLLDESAGYPGGTTNEPAERTTGMCTVTTMASARF